MAQGELSHPAIYVYENSGLNNDFVDKFYIRPRLKVILGSF